jgi:hypothetical protein
MKLPVELTAAGARAGERGGARLKFLLVMAAIGALVLVGAQYVPAKYHAWQFERVMQDTVETAVSTNKTPAWAEQQLRQNLGANDIPEDAAVEVARDGKRMKASVRYTMPISLLVTEYEYDFDVKVTSVRVMGGM